MRSNSSTTMSATLGSTRSRSANIDQNWRSMRPRPSEWGSRPSSGRRQPHERLVAAADEGQRRAQQREAADAAGLAQPDLERDAAAHRVADQVRALDPQRVHDPERRAGEERRAVAGQRGLAGAAEARQVERMHAVGAAERGGGVEERRLRRAQAVQQQHVGPLAHGERRDAACRARARRRGCARAAGGRWGGGTCPRSRPRGRGRRGRRGGARRTPRRRTARRGAAAARSRRRCRSRRRRHGRSPRRGRGRRGWCSGPPRCARCPPGGCGRSRRSPTPPPGSARGAS